MRRSHPTTFGNSDLLPARDPSHERRKPTPDRSPPAWHEFSDKQEASKSQEENVARDVEAAMPPRAGEDEWGMLGGGVEVVVDGF
jgi:hypothetical protein